MWIAFSLLAYPCASVSENIFGQHEGKAFAIEPIPEHKLELTYYPPNQGRTGNQLMMIGAALSLAHKYGYNFCVHDSVLQAIGSDMLDNTSLKMCTTQTLEGAQALNIDGANGVGEASIFKAGSTALKLLADRKGHVTIQGYGQTAAYLDVPLVRRYFKWDRQVAEVCDIAFRELNVPSDRIAVAVHVRKTDFYEDKTHLEYFLKAVAVLKQRLGVEASRLCFIIKTDNRYWVKKKLIPALRQQTKSDCVHFPSAKKNCQLECQHRSAIPDMCVLTHCQHAIISGGTFSYMAALLLKHESGLVLYDRTG
jgi:hypothetical protein